MTPAASDFSGWTLSAIVNENGLFDLKSHTSHDFIDPSLKKWAAIWSKVTF